MPIRCLGGSYETCVAWSDLKSIRQSHFLHLIVQAIEFLLGCKCVPENNFHKV